MSPVARSDDQGLAPKQAKWATAIAKNTCSSGLRPHSLGRARCTSARSVVAGALASSSIFHNFVTPTSLVLGLATLIRGGADKANGVIPPERREEVLFNYPLKGFILIHILVDLSLLFFSCGTEDHEDPCQSISICPIPQAPAMDIIHPVSLEFTEACYAADQIQTGTSNDIKADAPDIWMNTNIVELDSQETPYLIKVFARIKPETCTEEQIFQHVYKVSSDYPPAAGDAQSTAIRMDDPRIKAWATGWVAPVPYGEYVSEKWRTPKKAIGPAVGTSKDVVSLGMGGEITMVFEPPIRNRTGYDFVIFENSTEEGYLEIAAVEVSSNGDDFVRFDNAYLGKIKVNTFGRHDTKLIGSFAGKYIQGWGTPFDMRALANKAEVASGKVDLNSITFIKIVDIIGDGRETDSFGNSVYDPFPTRDSAGFDLEAIGIMKNITNDLVQTEDSYSEGG